MKLNEPTPHKTQMEIFHELDGHKPAFLLTTNIGELRTVCLSVNATTKIFGVSAVNTTQTPPLLNLWTFGCN